MTRAATPGIDPRFVGAAARAAGRAGRHRAGRGGAADRGGWADGRPRPVRRRVLPQRPRRAPRGRRPAVAPEARVVTRERDRPAGRRAARSRPRRGPRRRRPGPRAPDRTGPGRRHQVQRRRRRHPGRPRQRGADPRARRGPPSRRRYVGEEDRHAAGTTGVRWMVDPIDGTVNFLYGLPQYAVSIAAERDGEVVAGVVLNAATGVEYVATPGGRRVATAGRLAVRGPAPLHQRLVFTGFGYDAAKRGVQAAAVARLLPGCATSAGSARARSTCATSPRAPPTATSRRACSSGTTPPARSSRPRPGPGRAAPGRHGTPAVVAAPEHGFAEFLEAVGTPASCHRRGHPSGA